MEGGGNLLILAQGGSWETRFQVSSLASSEAAAGRAVDIALFFGALDAWVRERWSVLDPEPPVDRDRLDSLALPPLADLLAAGRREGSLRLFACSASVRILGLDTAQVQAKVDAILGWQSFSRMISRAPRVISF